MGRVMIGICLLLAACGAPAQDDVAANGTGTGNAVVAASPAATPIATASVPQAATSSAAALPADNAGDGSDDTVASESTLATQCAAGASYPDGRVRPAFYSYPPPQEYERYVRCVEAEARRDGGGKLASPASFPAVGTCYATRIREVAGRLGGVPDEAMGTSVSFDNKLHLVDYALVPAAVRSRAGDRARACVVELPKDCPADDLRGITYRVVNLRTGERWTMTDSQHLCRGA